MNTIRYEELVSLFMDDEPDEVQLSELAQMLDEDAALARDFRKQLLIWEAWSQAASPERSAEAFLAAVQTRQRAEADHDRFPANVRQRLESRRKTIVFRAVLAAAASIAVLVSFGLFLRAARSEIAKNPIPTSDIRFVSIDGESVCTRCTLHQPGEHNNAIRYVDAQGETRVVKLASIPSKKSCAGESCGTCTGEFCNGPTPVWVEGEFVQQAGQRLLAVERLTTLAKK